MDDKTISRIEEKYLISATEKTALLSSLEQPYLAPDRFFEEEVLSVYFDTLDFRIANRSIERPAFRFKLRVRSYNTPKKTTPVFFEIKSKYAHLHEHFGNKRRLVLYLGDFYKYLNQKSALQPLAEKYTKDFINHNPSATIPVTPFHQTQFAEELDYMMHLYHPTPRVLISANRFAYVAKRDPSFRLTFDHDLRFRTSNLKLEKGSAGTAFFATAGSKNSRDHPSYHAEDTPLDPSGHPRNIIMEVKTLDSMPLWFVSELTHLNITPARFSKYGKIFQYLSEQTHFNTIKNPELPVSSSVSARKPRKTLIRKENHV